MLLLHEKKKKNRRTLATTPPPLAAGDGSLRFQKPLSESGAGPAPRARSLAPRAAAPARFPRQPHAARRVSGGTRHQRRPGTRIAEPEPRSQAGERPRLAQCGGERLCALRPCAGIPRAFSRHHSQARLWPQTAAWTHPWGFTLSFQVGRWRVWLGCQYHRANEGQSQASTLMACFPACTAQPSGRHVGLGAGTSLGPGPSSASNLLCGLQNPLSCLDLKDGNTQNSFYQVCEITCKSGLQTVKCFARVKDCHRGHPVAFLPSSSP